MNCRIIIFLGFSNVGNLFRPNVFAKYNMLLWSTHCNKLLIIKQIHFQTLRAERILRSDVISLMKTTNTSRVNCCCSTLSTGIELTEVIINDGHNLYENVDGGGSEESANGKKRNFQLKITIFSMYYYITCIFMLEFDRVPT